METPISNKNISHPTPASGKACIVLEIPKQDVDFLYKLFDIYCDDYREVFYPETWISNTVSNAIQELKQGVREKLR